MVAFIVCPTSRLPLLTIGFALTAPTAIIPAFGGTMIAGIIAVGAVKAKPIVNNGNLEVGQTMNATISADHRVGDGAEAAIFLSEFQKTLENPVRLML
jgi:pyruvate/2-oxoglutarate dehydrogenase complex dihydrolipoamide acyltransferase (E2) component